MEEEKKKTDKAVITTLVEDKSQQTKLVRFEEIRRLRRKIRKLKDENYDIDTKLDLFYDSLLFKAEKMSELVTVPCEKQFHFDDGLKDTLLTFKKGDATVIVKVGVCHIDVDNQYFETVNEAADLVIKKMSAAV